ncbi:Thioredoxin Trx2 [Helicobacter sp. NHP21005]|uniref:thioredoxin family protein n=1 Tax=Helicobacter felistomachi TaxID=3040201 RepID=UPI002573C061|nr:thioredoxin family protein [Helicobacter sp. NHP21005]BEG56938.1 Thioredoxin Trx2 [Helicobacter sp. NHP21005]
MEVLTGQNYHEKTSQGAVVVNVGANWCPDCHKIAPMMDALAKDYSQVQVFKVDFDKSEDLKESLGIKRIPTLIFYKDGAEVGQRLVEPDTKSIIEAEFKRLV